MTSIDPRDSQPLRNPEPHVRRQYVKAEWKKKENPDDSPKVGGGVTIDEHGAVITARAFNRPDQRYNIDPADALARRLSRAAAEYSDTVILRGAGSVIELRAKSGNNYDLPADCSTCDCPDAMRLRESYEEDVKCKHRLMAETAVSVVGGFLNLDWSCDYLAERLGVDLRTAQGYCERGEVSAFKVHNVWVIPRNEDNVERALLLLSRQVGDAITIEEVLPSESDFTE